MRFQLVGQDAPILKHLRFSIMVNTDKEYTAGFRYIVTKYFSLSTQQVVNENESGYLPPLETKIANIEKYDIVFVGFPTWDMKMPRQ